MDSAALVQVFFFNVGCSGNNRIKTFQGMLMNFYNRCEISFPGHLAEEIILIRSNFIVVDCLR